MFSGNKPSLTFNNDLEQLFSNIASTKFTQGLATLTLEILNPEHI